MNRIQIINNEMGSKLKFVHFHDLTLWDVKRYSRRRIDSNYPIIKLGKYLQEESHRVKLNNFPEVNFGILGVSNKEGIFDAYKEKGENINQSYKRMDVNWIAYNPYRINVGSIGMKTELNNYKYISPAYVVFSCKEGLLPDFLLKLIKTNRFNEIINDNTTGSVRQSLTYEALKDILIPLPPVDKQIEILNNYYDEYNKAIDCEEKSRKLNEKIDDYLSNKLGITHSNIDNTTKHGKIKFVNYRDISEWGINKINSINLDLSKLYPTISIQKNRNTIINAFRGKSPIYEKTSDSFILNQKCIKWNEIDLRYVKSVKKDWLNKIDEDFFTKVGDVLINSTGEGTIGRSSLVTLDYQGLMYDSHVLCFRFNEKIINPLYWVYLFNSDYVQEQINTLKSAQSTKQTELGISNVLKVQIPLPELDVQNEIIQHISLIKSEANTLKEKAELSFQKAINKFEQELFL